MTKKILVVIDVSNIYYSVRKEYDARLDYRKLMDAIKDEGDIYRAIAYGAEIDDGAAGFKAMLSSLGIEPKYKQLKIYIENGREIKKGNWDVGIAMDVVRMVNNVDIVAFVTADGDLLPCLEYVQNLGKLAYVYGCRISADLRGQADYCQEINGHMIESPVTVA